MEYTVSKVKQLAAAIQTETEKIIVGKSDKIRLLTMAILSGGHVLLDDLPGVGKTTLVKTVSIALGCDFRRIQFVPDLLPGDILGTNIYNQKTGEFELRQGPVMTNLLLADEINRAIPRTQSALLEAMEEHQVTIDGQLLRLPEPFVVLATQNPVESESTFRLPAAQMDRFMVRMSMGYPTAEEEREMLHRLGDTMSYDMVEAVTCAQELMELRKVIAGVVVSDPVADYIVALTGATRNHKRLKMGAGPRASRALYQASKTWAAMDGRSFVTPDDVKTLVHPVLEHRLLPAGSSRLAGGTAAELLDEVLSSTEIPVSAQQLLDR